MQRCDYRKKPSTDRGFVMDYFEERFMTTSEKAKIRMKHKPYSNGKDLKKILK